MGQLFQAATVALSILGAVFAAGSYVQAIRDDIRSAERVRNADDIQIGAVLRDLLTEVAEARKQANAASAKAAQAIAERPHGN